MQSDKSEKSNSKVANVLTPHIHVERIISKSWLHLQVEKRKYIFRIKLDRILYVVIVIKRGSRINTILIKV